MTTLRTIRLLIEYDGTPFRGWQIQRNGKTVQSEIRRAFRKVSGEWVVVQGASRTDSGVHAQGQVAHVRTRTRIPADRIAHALNAHLPESIVVLASDEAPEGFHAQYGAKSKWYRYLVLNRRVRSSLDRDRVWLIRAPLDLDRMRAAARHLVGRHDFRAFATEVADENSTVRRVTKLTITRKGDLLTFDVRGGGFLNHMVRGIVGTLVEVGLGKRPPGEIPAILASRDRSRAGQNAPAQGLCLMSVRYGNPKSQRPNPSKIPTAKSQYPQ